MPPPAAEIRWAWLRDPSALGVTHFDEDRDPHLVEIRHGLAPSTARLVVMHELSHIRNPEARCSPPDRWWRAETLRLAQLGAFAREELF